MDAQLNVPTIYRNSIKAFKVVSQLIRKPFYKKWDYCKTKYGGRWKAPRGRVEAARRIYILYRFKSKKIDFDLQVTTSESATPL